MNERVHKSFRVWLFETGIRVQQTDFTDTEAGSGVTLELQHVLKALDRKCLLETRFFFPALALQAPFSVTLLEDQKREVQAQAHALERLLLQYSEPGTSGHYTKTGMAIQGAFCRLVSLLMVYMNQQDSLFRESGEPDENGTVFPEDIAGLLSGGSDTYAWTVFMLRGMGEKEISNWLESNTGTPATIKWAMLECGNPQTYLRLQHHKDKHGLRVAA